jgi:hypothetical protein
MPPPTHAEWWEMSFQPSLFGGEPTFNRQALATKLKRLSERNVSIGMSSWRYEGWLNQVYTPERYQTRDRFSKQKFHDECSQEYAETFPVVGTDFSFYAIPEPPFWKKGFRRRSPAAQMEPEGSGGIHRQAFLGLGSLWTAPRPGKPCFPSCRAIRVRVPRTIGAIPGSNRSSHF